MRYLLEFQRFSLSPEVSAFARNFAFHQGFRPSPPFARGFVFRRGFSNSSGGFILRLSPSLAYNSVVNGRPLEGKFNSTTGTFIIRKFHWKALTSHRKRKLTTAAYPNHIMINMPALSPTMTLGNVGTWRKQVGDPVSPGDVLVEIETDKAQMDFECQEEGYLAKIFVESGTKEVNVGQPIAILVENEEDVNKFKDFVSEQSSAPSKTGSDEKGEESAKPKEEPKEEPKQQEESAKSHISSDRIFASPVARKLAAERGISLDQVTGTGPKNRIIKADILNFVPAAEQKTPSQHVETTSSYIEIPLTNMRKIIGSRLSESKQSIPHYYLTIEVEVDKLLELREVLNKDSDGKYKISVNDFVIKSSASALMAMPEVNSTWHNDFIRQYNHADISIATATSTGLITPIIRNAQAKGLETISKETRELAARAREGKLAPHEYQGGSFTISNLGMYGIKHFTAIINPPHSCILAVGTTQKKLVHDPSKETGYRIATTMHMTLSCDHRVVDGAMGSQWLSVLRTYIEKPLKLLL